MPTITITSEQRRGLYELVRNHISGLGDVWLVMEQNSDFATAERLGREFAEDVLLLNDLGWHPGDERAAFELTMPADDLAEALDRLRGEAERLLDESPTERRSRADDEKVNSRVETGLNTCGELLAISSRREGDVA